ncbi:MAG: gliding motility-associated C-terminal domain-containing protein, partial [Bacteroidia bacterium]|nr:gliding motility-associated C-terminal domain-containing protein [Bacteroidia bacterium]
TNGNPVSDDSDDPTDPTDVDPDGDGDPDDPTVTGLTQTPDITLTKTASISNSSDVGAIITYTFSVENTGNVTITNLIIDDILTNSFGLIVTPSTLAPNEIGIATATYIVTQNDMDLGYIDNSANAIGDSPNGSGDVSDVSDAGDEFTETPDGADNTNGDPTDDPTVVLLSQKPEITLTKTAVVGGAGGSIGDVVTYTFTLENTGNVTVYNITLDDAFLNASGVLISPSDLLPGEIGTATLTHIITIEDVSLGYIENSAIASGFDLNGDDVSDVSDAGDEFTETPDGEDNTNGDPTDDPTVILLIPEDEEIIIYDAISPDDGDGINDVFTIAGLQNFPDNNLKIYNRWGVLVFENDAYHLGPFFDGTSNGRVTITKEEKLPSGVYYYVLTYVSSNEVKSKAGPLYINR